MEGNIILYDEKYELEEFEAQFMNRFRETHSLSEAMSLLHNKEKVLIKSRLRDGKSELGNAFKEFVENAPVHPEANKVVILDNLVWIMNQAKIDQDTQGVLRAITEINKMIKGNLVSTNDKTTVEKHFVGLIDLSKKEEEQKTIDVEFKED